MTELVEFFEISHSYQPGHTVLDDINFTIREGEFVAVIGPSGCGKSTLLRMLSGLLQPSSGALKFKKGHQYLQTGMVFQKATLLPWLNVNENILFPAKHKFGKITSTHRAKAQRLLEKIQLENFSHALPSTLSGGMKQKVAIARALLLDPDILLMDEPFSALDALSREKMAQELKAMLKGTSKTVLFITHSIPEAVSLADRVLVLGPRPAKVLANLDIDREKLATTPSEFQDMCARIHAYLFQREAAL